MIAPTKLSKRQRREIVAREFLSIRIDPLSNGEWRATLTEQATPQDIERYVSASQPTPAEVLSLAEYELHQLVEKRVEALERQDYADELAQCSTEDERREVMADWGMA